MGLQVQDPEDQIYFQLELMDLRNNSMASIARMLLRILADQVDMEVVGEPKS